MKNKITVSNILILLSAIITLLAYYMPSLYLFGMNNHFLDEWLYHIYIIQFFIGSFLHWSLVHFLANGLFLFLFGNIIEMIMWKKMYIKFFIFTTFFNWFLISLFADWNTVWISWFCMALISYYTLDLKYKNNPEYKWWITALFINIWIWFIPWISLYWHLFWAIAWIIFFFINKNILKKQLIWNIIIEKS
jgi:hypothetical protein